MHVKHWHTSDHHRATRRPHLRLGGVMTSYHLRSTSPIHLRAVSTSGPLLSSNSRSSCCRTLSQWARVQKLLREISRHLSISAFTYVYIVSVMLRCHEYACGISKFESPTYTCMHRLRYDHTITVHCKFIIQCAKGDKTPDRKSQKIVQEGQTMNA